MRKWLLSLLIVGFATAALAAGTVIKSELKFTDPDLDAIFFWDDSANDIKTLNIGSGLEITGTTLNATAQDAIWGNITGTLSSQTDLQSALDGKVPTTRTITINGVTYDLSANRSWTITGYSDEEAQDAVGNILTDSSELDFTYNDASATITAALKTGIDPIKLGAGLVSSTELGYLDGATSNIQTQLDSKFTLPALTAGSVIYSDGSTLSQSNQNFYYNNSQLDVWGGLGSEKISNGGFTGGTSSWTTNTGWTYSSNAIHHSSNGTGVLSQNPSFLVGEYYLLSLDASNFTTGSFTITAAGNTVATISANGSYSYRIGAINTSALTISPTNTSRFSLDNISIKKFQNGVITTNVLGIGGANTSPSTTQIMTTVNQSNSSPGATRVWSINNQGGYSWIDFLFNGVAKAHIGADSGGELKLYSGGGNYVNFINKNTSGSMAVLYPSAFLHYGSGIFANKVMAGGYSEGQSTLQSAGSLASKVKRITANQVLDGTATKWLCDGSSAACSGTPTNTCASHGNESACDANDAHGGCTWNAGYSCNAFNGNQYSCESTSGCSYETADCGSVGAYDESSCNSHSGCSWTNTGGDCSSFDESTCTGTSGCGANYDYCFNYSDGGGDGTSCSSVSGYGCNYDSGSGACSDGVGDSGWFTSCSGSYDNYSCSGTYYTGTCSGTYGASCSGTSSCTGIDDSTSCGAETGCSYSTVLTAGLPPISTATDRDVYVVNDSTSGADCVLDPDGSETIDGSATYTLANYKDWVHLSPFIKTASCSGYNESTCGSSTGCSQQYASCTWDSMMSSCSGDDPSCSGYGDQAACEAATYYSYCSGTHIQTRNWYKFGS